MLPSIAYYLVVCGTECPIFISPRRSFCFQLQLPNSHRETSRACKNDRLWRSFLPSNLTGLTPHVSCVVNTLSRPCFLASRCFSLLSGAPIRSCSHAHLACHRTHSHLAWSNSRLAWYRMVHSPLSPSVPLLDSRTVAIRHRPGVLLSGITLRPLDRLRVGIVPHHRFLNPPTHVHLDTGPPNLPPPSRGKTEIFPLGHTALTDVLGLDLAYLNAPDYSAEIQPGHGSILSLFLNDPLVKAILPAPPLSSLPSKDLQAIQSKIMALEALANKPANPSTHQTFPNPIIRCEGLHHLTAKCRGRGDSVHMAR
jgi:hypothetical protein